MGADLVDANTTDPLQRRLLNVVEEMAMASSVPVPAVPLTVLAYGELSQSFWPN